ncbi:putative periplasmic binding protein-like I [Rosa chinensis]|uniref:Glutamate receptor n=1 Tax=Rosa chinensis TaxID=74649 RepID=A0A2P6Q4G4_ROSCH|nr:glutamate receptor 2.7 [Rosa chinensis]PRQ29071.1 putative periplasmic binding protein-like I [Rosa chinensis]
MSYSTAKTVQRLAILFPLLIIYLLFNLSYAVEAEDEKKITNIGAIIDVNSRIGKEQKAAMEIAAENFNNQSDTHELILHFRDSGRDPFLAAYAAKHLKREQKVQVVIGMETWQEAVTVADVVKNLSDQIPVISFAAPTISPPLIQRRWPSLIRMATDGAAQMKCIGDIVNAYNWKRVVVIYEDDGYGGGVGRLAILSETLRNVGSTIELRIVLPRLSEPDTNWDEIKKQLLEISNVNSRAFIVLQSSLPTVTGLFKVARKMGFVGNDSAWIITESIASLLDPHGNYDMEGTLGIKTYYANESSSYAEFQKEFQAKHAEENNSKPGIYALRAYDTINAISQAIEGIPNNTTSTSLQGMITRSLSNYNGLSGKMQLKGGEVPLDSPRFRIINIVGGKTDNELNFWIPDFGFSESLEKVSDKYRSNDGVGKVIWPGNPTLPSKGWAMPTDEKPMKILLPAYHENFVRHISGENSNEMGKEGLCLGKEKHGLCSGKIYDGLSIDLFCCVLSKLNYSLPHEFELFNKANGTYNDMVELVYNKTFDAVIGDMTVLASRIDKVDFTQPYLESGLSLIVPDKSNESTWLFMKPFTWQMWVASCAILIYTMLIIWFLEGPSSPEFDGPLMNQIATATWFSFSSLFFAHREKIYSNLTRVVFIVWLFVVFILNSSYTANLSSMLTIQRLSPNVTDIEMLRTTNSLVGCDNDSFVRDYLENVLQLKNIETVESNLKPDTFSSNTRLSAVFLELPYAEVFMNDYCEGFTNTKATYSFGGFSFAFQKGSPIARNFSKVILDLLENGKMRELRDHWLNPSKCPTNTTSDMPENLTIESFWGIFVISGATSTLCLLSSAILKKFGHQAASGTRPENSVQVL